jgi:hypothetical protein
VCLSGEEEQNVELQLKTFGSQKDKGAVILVVNACSNMGIALSGTLPWKSLLDGRRKR